MEEEKESVPKKQSKEEQLEEIKVANAKMEELLTKRAELIVREERVAAQNSLGGRSDVEKPAKPAKLTDEEYADALNKGEVNPLKEDGFAE